MPSCPIRLASGFNFFVWIQALRGPCCIYLFSVEPSVSRVCKVTWEVSEEGDQGQAHSWLDSSFCSPRQWVLAWTPPLLVRRKEMTILAGSILRKPEEPGFESQPCHFKLCDLGHVPFPLGSQLPCLTTMACLREARLGLF